MSKNNNRKTNETPVIENTNIDQATDEKLVAPATEDHSKKTYNVKSLFEEHKTKSAVIRFLSGEGLKVSEIHKLLVEGGIKNNEGTNDIRYQHVRNVLKTPVQKTMIPSSDPSNQPVQTTEA